MPTASLGAIVPAVPFPSPVAPPTGFGVSRLAFTIDAVWWPYLIGCAKVLTANSTFDPPDPNPAVVAVQQAYKLLDDLMAAVPVVPPSDIPGGCGCDCEDCMQLRFNGCTLQAFDCLTQTWVDIPQVGSCVSNPAPGGGITPPVGQKCQEYNISFYANALTILPFLVNTGDTLAITTLVGAGNDGTLNWYCINGQYFIGGTCSGGEFTQSTDPIPTANHMSCVLKIGANYYPFTSGTFTVPSGVVNQQIYIGVNDAPISDNDGTYAIDFVFCNNQAAPVTNWCRFADMTISPNGGVGTTDPDSNGHHHPNPYWTLGSGWAADATLISPSTTYENEPRIAFDLGAPTALDFAQVEGAIGASASGTFQVFIQASNDPTFATGTVNLAGNAALTAGAAYSVGGSISPVTYRYVRFWSDCFSLPAAVAPVVTLTQLTLKGTGTAPTIGVSC